MHAGAVRIDLTGEPAGTVTAEAAHKAAEELANRMLRADTRRKARKAEERPAAKPEPVPDDKPRRLTLADLKTAFAAPARKQEANAMSDLQLAYDVAAGEFARLNYPDELPSAEELAATALAGQKEREQWRRATDELIVLLIRSILQINRGRENARSSVPQV
jgi:sRNA-binding protein